MIYKVVIKFYSEVNDKYEVVGIFIHGDSYTHVMERLVDYFGEIYIEEVDIKCFSPDSFLIFEDMEDLKLFKAVEEQLGKKVVW